KCILWQRSQLSSIRDCTFYYALRGVQADIENYGITIENCRFTGDVKPGSMGVVGGWITIINSDFSGNEEGVRFQGSGTMLNCRIEMARRGIVVGLDPNGVETLPSVNIQLIGFEGCETALYVHGATLSRFSQMSIQGHDFAFEHGTQYGLKIDMCMN